MNLKKMDFYLMRRERNRQKRIATQKLKMRLKNIRTNEDPFDLPDSLFHKYFRLQKGNVVTLISELAAKSRFHSIPFKLQVLATLHFYGQGSYQASIGSNNVLGLSQPSVSRCIENVTLLINKYLVPKHITFPTTILEKTRNKIRFQDKYGMRDIIGVIDGVQITIVAPPDNSVETPGNLYICRKGYHSINSLVCCNADLTILYADASFPESVHDSAIWKTSQLRNHFSNRYSSIDTQTEFLIGDSGFPLEPWLFTPYANPSSDTEIRFNAKFNTGRNCVERLFGVLKSRFRCLLRHRVLHYSPKKAAQIIYAIFALHNKFLNDTAIDVDELIEFDRLELTNDQFSNEALEMDTSINRNQWRNLGYQIRDQYASNL